jgi:hypothetical protein
VETLTALDLLADGASAFDSCGLGAVAVLAAEIDFSTVGSGGMACSVPGFPGRPAPAPAAG